MAVQSLQDMIIELCAA